PLLCFCLPRPPASALFPYTTLFRSVLLILLDVGQQGLIFLAAEVMTLAQRAAGVLDFLKDVSAGHVSLLGGRFRLRGRSSGSRGASLRPRVELVARALGLRVVSVAAQTGSGARLGSEPG